jgi:hypothetical protein
MHTGMGKVGPSVPVTMITDHQLLDNLDAFVTADGTYNSARSAAHAQSALYQDSLAAVHTWLLTARGVLVDKLGRRWTTAWAQAGFVNGSTAVPRRTQEQLSLLLTLSGFFTANPTYQNAALGITAALAITTRDAALAAQSALADAEMLLKDADEARTPARTTLMNTMRTLISNLSRMLEPLDPRWLAFGLNQPGVNTTPGKPQNLTAHADGAGNIVVTCDAEPLATRYRWRALLVGVQTEYYLAASSVDPMGLIKNIQPGQTVRLIVQAVNGDSQGVASDPIEFTMPLAAEELTKAAAPALELPLVENGATNGNGHAIGHPVAARA